MSASTPSAHHFDQCLTNSQSANSSRIGTETKIEDPMDTGHAPRTKDEAIRDLDYLIRLSQRHRRFFDRAQATLRFTQLFFGSAAFAVALNVDPVALQVAGVGLAAIAALNFAFDPGARAREHSRCGSDYSKLRAECSALPIEEIDRLRTLVVDPNYIESLRMPSWNDMMRSHGFVSSARPLTCRQWVMSALA